MEIKELTTKSHETARKMPPGSYFFAFVRGSSPKDVEIRLLDRIFAPNIVRSFLLAAIFAGMYIAVPAQPPTPWQVKQAAAYDALRDGRRLLERETLEENRKAYVLILKARAMYKEMADRDGEGLALFAASQAALALGDRQAAFRFAKEAVPLFTNNRHKWWQARFYNHMGLLGTSVGEREYSVKFYWLSLRIYKELDDFDGAIPVINNIGRHFEEGGEYEKALEMFNLTLRYIDGGALDVRLSEEANRGLVLNNIAGVYLKQGKTAESLETYERALALHRNANLPRAAMSTINNIGTVYYKTGDYEKARDRFNQALLLNRLVGDKPVEALTLMNLMSVLHRTGNSREAVFFGKQAINLYQWMRSNIRGFGDKYTEKTYLRTIENDYRALTDILIEAGLFTQAEQVLRMLKEEEFFEFVGRDENEIASLGQRVALTPKEQELIARYTSLSGRITTIGARFLTLDARKRLLEQKRESLTSAEQTEYDLLSSQLADANAAFRLFLDKELSRELSAENRQTIEYDRGLQANIGLWEKGTVVLHTVVVQNRYRSC
jgi:tetratricopeptide (TPR) repeat protein